MDEQVLMPGYKVCCTLDRVGELKSSVGKSGCKQVSGKHQW